MDGRLIYVMGPSGGGKDSVMSYARERCSPALAIFAHRYITRSPHAGGENHVSVSPDEFQARLGGGLFALNWDSHGFRYGVGVEIDIWMRAGLNVVLNGSRGFLPQAAKRYPEMVPVQIVVDREILRQRLIARGRESREEVECRLERATWFDCRHGNLVCVDNSGELPEAGENLLKIIQPSGVSF